MIYNYMFGTGVGMPYNSLDIYGDGYFPQRSGIIGRPNLRGQLLGDTVEIMTKKEKDKRNWGTALKLIGVTIGGLICYKFLKGPIGKGINAIKNLFKRTPPTP